MEPKTWEYFFGPSKLTKRDARTLREYALSPGISTALLFSFAPAMVGCLTAIHFLKPSMYVDGELGLAVATAGFTTLTCYVMLLWFMNKELRAARARIAEGAMVRITATQEGLSWSWAGERISADWKDVKFIKRTADKVIVSIGPTSRVFYREDTNDDLTKIIEEMAAKPV